MLIGTSEGWVGAIEAADVGRLRALSERDPGGVDAVGSRGRTPLLAAAGASVLRLEVLELLLAAGARVDHAGEDGWTVLHALSQAEGEEARGPGLARIVARLVEAGAPLEAVTPWGWTPLTAALVEGHLELTRLLLRAGANPDVRFSPRAYPEFCRGWRLTHYCLVQPGGVLLLEALLEGRADARRTNADGETPLALAERMLREPEADMDASFLADVEACARLLRAR